MDEAEPMRFVRVMLVTAFGCSCYLSSVLADYSTAAIRLPVSLCVGMWCANETRRDKEE